MPGELKDESLLENGESVCPNGKGVDGNLLDEQVSDENKGNNNISKSSKDAEKDKEIPMKFLDIKILINGISDPIVVQLTNHDTVQDIRQVILEKPECCYRTCFSLYLGPTRLDDFMELHDIAGLDQESVIKVVDEPYSIREARIHIRRLRDLLVTVLEPNAFTATDNLSLSYCSVITEMDVEEEAWKSSKDPSQLPKVGGNVLPPSYATLNQKKLPLLEPLLMSDKEIPVPQCLVDLRYSAWNPPPGYRKLVGDLLYLEVCLLEDPDTVVHVTSSSSGFFVNKTTKGLFDPRPNNESYRSQTLAGLLTMVYMS